MRGVSKCPHEAGTKKREDPKFTSSGSLSSLVPPDEPIIFEVEIENVGSTEGEFKLEADQGEGNLVIMYDGSRMNEGGIDVRVGPESKKTKQIAIYRGPLKYRYNPVRLTLNTCSQSIPLELSNKVDSGTRTESIEFLKPCPKINWAGDLLRDQNFLVNAESFAKTGSKKMLIKVFNPAFTMGKLMELKEEMDRFKHVLFKYRRIGDIQWRIGLTTDSNNMDFLADQVGESNYGYLSLNWNLAGMEEGMYEIVVETKCAKVGTYFC